MSGWISENKLIISLSEDMAPGEYTVKIKKGVITDLSKNKMQDDFTLPSLGKQACKTTFPLFHPARRTLSDSGGFRHRDPFCQFHCF